MTTIETFKSYLTCLGLSTAPPAMLERRASWIDHLTEEDVVELLRWVENPQGDQLLSTLSHESALAVLQEAIIISATAGKTLGSQKILQMIQSLYKEESVKELVLEGIEIYAEPASLTFLEEILKDERNQEIIISIASALYNIGGEAALQLLNQIRSKVHFDKTHYENELNGMIEELKTSNH